MAEKLRRPLALLLALALVAGQLLLPALASEEDAADPAPLPEDVQVTVTPVEGGTQTVTTYTDPNTGADVTVTQTQTSFPGDGTQTSGEENGDAPPPSGTTTISNTTTESILSGNHQTDVSTTWDNDRTFTDTGTQESSTDTGTVTTTTDTSILTEVDGSQNSNETITWDDGPAIINGQLSGEETTTENGTVVTTTTQTGVTTQDDVTRREETVISGTYSSETKEDNDYTDGTVTREDWKDDPLDPATGTKTGSVTDSSTSILEPGYEGGSVTLNGLVPDGKTLVTRTYELNLDQLDNNCPSDATVIPRYENGEIVGWTVTYQEITSRYTGTSATEGQWEEAGAPRDSYINPGNYQTGLSGDTDVDLNTMDNGQTVVTRIEDIYVNGKYEGYRIITTTTTKTTSDTTDEAPGTRTDFGYEKEVGQTLDAGFTPPTPEMPVSDMEEHEDGSVTTVTYTPLEENGLVVGYTARTETRDSEGSLIRAETRNIYGTSHTIQTTVETDPTSERTTTTTLVTQTDIQEIRTIQTLQDMQKVDTRVSTYETTVVNHTDTYELVSTDDGMYFIYQGKMFQVEAIVSGDANAQAHGEASIVKTISPDIGYITAAKGQDLYNRNGTSDGLFFQFSADNPNRDTDSHPDGYEFRYIGNGAASTLNVRREDGGSNVARQFALRDSSGTVHYVYCCDVNIGADSGAYYEIQNIKDADYYQGNNAVDHIRAIATHGFWATSGSEDDVGTLKSVQKLLKDYDQYFDENLTEVARTLTEGEAMAATQAALWTFGHRNNGSKPDVKNILATGDEDNEDNVTALYKLLISDILMNHTDDPATDLIDTDDITGGSITVHDQIGQTGQGDVYRTDVSFTLKVEQSHLTGNLVAAIYQNGVRVSENIQIATNHSNFLGKAVADNPDNTTTVTFQSVELIEGVEFTIQLDGTQNMVEGVYLYKAEEGFEGSQTFVGVSAGTRKVSMAVDMVFTVSEPEIRHTDTTVTDTWLDTTEGTRLSTRTDRKVNRKVTNSGDVKTDVSHNIDIVSTVTTTATARSFTRANRQWEAYWTKLISYPEENPKPRSGPADKDVPLADPPRTGDITGLWAAISGLSLAGAALLSIRRREEQT